ncbi:PREDICTED: peritrophin-1-like [Ceratosolen solmsi marchali]|uniref:Peritrophin-1-like n=1 Tax=Ceratosolen solmsi marchali TaxID=326594 RepID=A0AAJ6YN69_9HYME|nr:PREDICTED: peritrophin-1-like [Ceratosolen solmsi marchali]
MLLLNSLLLLLALASKTGCQRITPRSPRASRNAAGLDFECPEEFGYYPHPRDCTQYYVCVFGGALLESCTGGLMYSHELQTCDWPRNVGCPENSSPSKDIDEDPLLER